jgi:hypothetical protein
VFCLVVGVVYAGVLYYKSKNSDRFAEYKWVQIVLPVLRFSLASLLAFLLLGPVLRYAGFETQKPIIAILVDDSKSIVQNDSAAEQIPASLRVLQTELGQKYEVNTISYSDVARFAPLDKLSYTGSESNLNQALRYVNEQYVNQNLGGVVLLGDGIYNAGSNPSFIADNYKVPIYTVGIGDTMVYADLSVNNVSHNSLAYLGNAFPFRIELKANKLQGNQVNMQVLLNGNMLTIKR